ncbi:hypothetical protein F4778DRAFT_777802 [Xylariomycetidae sp. FL2044]|nr:hypothetical protein F4778DRAFT_777802 [Xylariomycetidae sp. FL2044]
MASLQFIEPAGTIRASPLSTTGLPSAAAVAAFGSLNNIGHSHRRHSSNSNVNDSTSPAIQNQRVSQLIQASGQQTSPSGFTNRFNSSAQNHSPQQQFYASFSAPPSTAAVNQQNHSARPPVPLFTQGIGSQQPSAKMDLQDALSLEEFAAFEGGAPTPVYSSPGVPGYDVTVSSASSSINLGTVSPGELLISAPNSSALTGITTPSEFGESPEFETYDVSPNFGTSAGNFGDASSDNWFPLFPDGDSLGEPIQQGLDNSPAQQSVDFEVETPPQPRRKSTASSSPTGGHGRHSSVSGVNSRRRDKPLPPIIVEDPNDTIAMKRARNTLAARKSRERKAAKLEELEEKIASLEEERDHWRKLALSRTGGTSS